MSFDIPGSFSQCARAFIDTSTIPLHMFECVVFYIPFVAVDLEPIDSRSALVRFVFFSVSSFKLSINALMYVRGRGLRAISQ